MAANGISADQIAERANKRVGAVRASFIIDTLEFLYKGGRCSSLAYLGSQFAANKASYRSKDGRMGIATKPMGRYKRCVDKYGEWVKMQLYQAR